MTLPGRGEGSAALSPRLDDFGTSTRLEAPPGVFGVADVTQSVQRPLGTGYEEAKVAGRDVNESGFVVGGRM
jgi:hypothetical protein